MASISKILEAYPAFEEAKSALPQLNEIVDDSEPNRDDLLKIFSCIDLTSLSTDDTEDKITLMTKKVNNFKKYFPELPNVAAICVYPAMVEFVANALESKKTEIASVVGGFPSSQTFQEVKELETEMAVLYGATEADVVLSVGKFLSGKENAAAKEIKELKSLLGKKHLKVILESGLLTQEQVYRASLLALESGADFIKTSTGKLSPAATPEAVYAMCIALKEYFTKTGTRKGLKPAGGISSPGDAFVYIKIVRTILGEEWVNSSLFRIGASRLSNAVLAELCTEAEKIKLPYF